MSPPFPLAHGEHRAQRRYSHMATMGRDHQVVDGRHVAFPSPTNVSVEAGKNENETEVFTILEAF